VYVSSDEVLGEAFVALPESAPLRPTQPYAASKAAAEIILHCHRDVYGLSLVTLRSCNLVGPGQREPKLIPVAVRALLEGNPVPIHGSGEQLREWLAVEDFSTAILMLMDPSVPAGVYQASSGVHLSVFQVVECVARELKTPPSAVHVTDRMVQDGCYAMSAARLHGLGWRPQHDPIKAIGAAARALASELSA
jgi:dTDP-glucose 4,6-dehydratase